MCCKLINELASQYLRARDLVERANHKLRNAATQTNAECAATELRRVDEFRQDTLREIAEHCENHGCATRELEELCGLELVSAEMVAAEMASQESDSREMVA